MRDIKITDVRALSGDAGFLIDDGKTSILYDSGFGFTGYKVAENVKKALGDRKLDFIFLTHSHYDHALGSVYVKEYYPEAKVAAGEYAAKIFEKPTAKAVMRDLDKKFAEKNGVYEYEDLIDNLSVDIKVNDGDEIVAGDMKFTVVALPGHTKCSVGFYLEETGLLLGTETLGVYAGDGMVVPSYLVGYNMAMDSIDKASKLNINSILVPHYGVLNSDEAKAYLEKGKNSARETADEIIDILKNGGAKEQAVDHFMKKFYKGKVKEIYPIDAIELNTNIMVDLLTREFEI